MPIRTLIAALACALCTSAAHAQLRLPQLPLPQVPQLQQLQDPLRDSRRLLDRADAGDLRALRLERIAGLLRQHRAELEADPRGEPMVRGQILAWSPSAQGLAAAQAAGLAVDGEQVIDGGERMAVLRVPAGTATAAALAQLRMLDPDGAYDFNHVYMGSGAAGGNPAGAGTAAGAVAAAGAARAAAAAAGTAAAAGAGAGMDAAARGGAGARVGLVDGGVERGHEVFQDSSIVRWGCDGAAHPSQHGTAVAALMVGQSSRFKGVAPQAALYAADIYCDSATGGSAARVAAALGWMAREQVAVVNLSLVGPPNQILERVVAGMVRRGYLLVAAVGNDGPAAPPLYPASYPGVVGVSGVDKRGRPLPEAARGPQVMFAAPGSQMVSAAVGTPPYRVVRGTSFAAPIVAALLAGALPRPAPDAAREALAALARQAVGAAPGTQSNETGHGVLGAAFRTDPSAFQ
ncbi:S8 family serine peptidase [Pseudoduganella sp. UC29_71]|uniref:S8 family serine peptidase n=1 Tax=Pseudoduganella sp. UC29_71 TaxID=3350174 RepID=UPI00366AE4D7